MSRGSIGVLLVDDNPKFLATAADFVAVRARLSVVALASFTLHDRPEYRAAAAGADAFVSKSEFGTGLIPAMHLLLDGPQTEV